MSAKKARVGFIPDSPENVSKLADAFSENLINSFEPEELAEARTLDATDPDSIAGQISHLHDYYDANENMAEAFKCAFGRGELTTSPDTTPQSTVDADLNLWNQAWQLAKLRGYLPGADIAPLTPDEADEFFGPDENPDVAGNPVHDARQAPGHFLLVDVDARRIVGTGVVSLFGSDA